ncbi:hypothetical protein RchiOBHm_Chr4g0440861 [Rosa chinensis]|uniref:Secreted protein n=1 Tax=Rosa chinensis TaxID=74649 RepID=A0A2P6R372_ROSCH|nr:hypothetical protein RchiOBHm_Chr4g0440861 [Rosa chinensis]
MNPSKSIWVVVGLLCQFRLCHFVGNSWSESSKTWLSLRVGADCVAKHRSFSENGKPYVTMGITLWTCISRKIWDI